MSNLLQYTIQLRDQMTSVLNRIQGSTRSTNNSMNQLQRDTLNGSRALREIGASAHALRGKLEQLRAQREFISTRDIATIRRYNQEINLLERHISRVESSSRGGLVGGFTKAFQAIPFSGMLTNPLVMAGAGLAKTFSVGMQDEVNKSAFTVMLDSEAAADRLMGDLSKIKMDKNVLGENAKQLLSFDLDESTIVPVLDSIGNIAMGDANKMNSLSLAFAQMSSTGKLTGQDLMQMINAGFNPLSEISKKTGKSIGQLKEEMEKGKISSNMVRDAFYSATAEGGSFHGMLDMMAKTLGGRWQHWMTKANEKFIQLYHILSPLVTKMMDVTEKGFGMLWRGAKKMYDLVRQGNPWMWGLVSVLGAYVIGMGAAVAIQKTKVAWDFIVTGGLWSQVTAWWSLNAAMYANPIGLIIAGVIALVAFIGYLIYKVDGWGQAWSYTVQGAKLVWEAYVSFVKANFNTMVGGIMIGINKIQIAWFKFKNAIGLGDSSQNESIIASLNSSVDSQKEKIKSSWKDVKDNAVASGKAFRDAAGSLTWNKDKSITDVFRATKEKLMPSSGIADAKGGVGTMSGLGGNGVETKLGGAGKKGASKTNQATTTGGSKSNYITINLDALIKGLTINSDNSDDSSNQLQNKTTDALLRVLAMAITAGS